MFKKRYRVIFFCFPLILFNCCFKFENRKGLEYAEKREIIYKIERGENLISILKNLNLKRNEIFNFIYLFDKKLNSRKIKEQDKFIFDFKNDTLKEITYIKKNFPNILHVFKKEKEGFIYEKIVKKFKIDTLFLSIKIENTLFDSFSEIKDGFYLADVISYIFSWVIDFNTEVRKNDKLLLICERRFLDGKFISYGKILYAEYNGNYTGRKIAIYFKDSYYDENGESLSKYFLKSPLPYGRITSPFKLKRFHPILRVYRPHHGIDYGAPRGTKVLAIADGRVIYSGWKNGYGYYVKIKHKNGFESGYGHLMRIRRGIKKGKKVKQGEVIGYVGSTGLSTGPHLHFEMRKNGKYINFLKLKFAPRKVLKGKDKEEIKKLFLFWKKRINEKFISLAYNK